MKQWLVLQFIVTACLIGAPCAFATDDADKSMVDDQSRQIQETTTIAVEREDSSLDENEEAVDLQQQPKRKTEDVSGWLPEALTACPPELQSEMLERVLSPVKEQLKRYILNLQQPKRRTFKSLKSNSGRADLFLVTPDSSKIILTRTIKSLLEIWDMESGQLLYTLDHGEEIWFIAMSHDGSKVVSSSGNGVLKVWDINKRECLHTLEGHDRTVVSVEFSPDDGKLVSGSREDGTLRVWDLSNGHCLYSFHAHRGDVRLARFISEGNQIISVGEYDDWIKIWDIHTGKGLRAFQTGNIASASLSLSQDGKRLAFGINSDIGVWDVESGERIHMLNIQLADYHQYINSVRFSPDGTKVVFTLGYPIYSQFRHVGGIIQIWDVSDERCLHILNEHISSINTISFSLDGEKLVSDSLDHTTKIWDVHQGKCLHTIPTAFCNRQCVFTPDNTKLVSLASDNAYIWRLYDHEDDEALEALTYSLDRLSPNQKMLLYILHQNKCANEESVEALDLLEMEKTIKNSFGDRPIPSLFNLEEAYDQLPSALKKVVTNYFGIVCRQKQI